MDTADKKNILVIENQQCEFECIVDFLKNDYNIYPSTVDNWEKFINSIHIALNKYYSAEYRSLALNYIKKIVKGDDDPFGNERPIDLILMDHILGSAHYCHTGIDLANYLNFDRAIKIPIVFLSRTPQDGKNKLEGSCYDELSFDLSDSSPHRMGYEKHYIDKYPNSSCWVHKGYFGEGVLDNTDQDNDTLNYFHKYVLSAIKTIMPLSEREKLINAISHILANYSFGPNETEIKNQLERIKERISNETICDEFKNYIFDIRSKYDKEKYEQMGDNNIEIIKKQYESLPN